MQDVLQGAIVALLNVPEDKRESAARAILDFAFDGRETDLARSLGKGGGALDDAVVETANDLVIRCTAAARRDDDFATVWNSILKGHPLVVSSPIQTFADDMHP
jgi:hypothetical protein